MKTSVNKAAIETKQFAHVKLLSIYAQLGLLSYCIMDISKYLSNIMLKRIIPITLLLQFPGSKKQYILSYSARKKISVYVVAGTLEENINFPSINFRGRKENNITIRITVQQQQNRYLNISHSSLCELNSNEIIINKYCALLVWYASKFCKKFNMNRNAIHICERDMGSAHNVSNIIRILHTATKYPLNI